ncbi:CaiB/BaiF CoA-transferase family protein [Rhodococcus sp. T2V]|uniref:CaiB/BaiF CoA transferase family protein n=1 Tax=Rhodococcus sp. T2V TaxID=3034164 RepID=UPI0023E28AC2|nr:CaiB/BaiF CoA-transferase family protein [Rhodococcus sp. T2V]MDF3304550.1 CaiB/BaiF CoA-transferase family protein [Rhodococcus sp. T2V]
MGPLAGISVVEFAGIGPTPFVALLLSDLGADVITIDRVPSADGGTPDDLVRMTTGGLGRGRRSVAVDLKSPGGIDTVLELLKNADGLIEGYRPGVMERLGLGPEVCLARKPRLVFGRMTGWGQDGDLAQRAGHDLNYIAVAGVLHHIGGRDQAPTVPLNLIGDFGGGGLLLAFGMVAAMLEAKNSGRGQVVDASMAEGSALLMTMMYELSGRGMWDHDRESNMNDGGAHFYSVYATSDDKYVAVAAMEPKFYANLLAALGLDDRDLLDQWDRSQWPALREVFAEIFRTRTRDAWTALLENTDSCVTPVLSMLEAPSHRHNVSRNAFIKVDDITQPAPAPRFSRTPTRVRRGVAEPGQHSVEVLREAGMDEARIDALLASGSIAATNQEVTA